MRAAERLARLALELRRPARDAGCRVALSRVLPWRAEQAAIRRVAGAVALECAWRTLEFHVAEGLAEIELVLPCGARNAVLLGCMPLEGIWNAPNAFQLPSLVSILARRARKLHATLRKVAWFCNPNAVVHALARLVLSRGAQPAAQLPCLTLVFACAATGGIFKPFVLLELACRARVTTRCTR